jgi:tungstate transport system substrate-binding protein
MRRRALLLAWATVLTVALASSAVRAAPFITVASTTSTENSGLFGYLLPIFTGRTGIDVHVVAVGTGQAIKIAERGDADVLFVHDKPAEEKFVAAGYSTERRDVMYNDFVIVGPEDDPAHIKGDSSAAKAMATIAGAKVPFVSRGDESGTNAKELELWRAAGIEPARAGQGSWYRETGSGMGATLNTAAAMDGYTLTDRGTWISFKNKGDLEVLVEGDPDLFNQYGIMLVNPARFPQVKAKDGQAFVDWVLSPEGQKAIAGYKIAGKQLFFPNAGS